MYAEDPKKRVSAEMDDGELDRVTGGVAEQTQQKSKNRRKTGFPKDRDAGIPEGIRMPDSVLPVDSDLSGNEQGMKRNI